MTEGSATNPDDQQTRDTNASAIEIVAPRHPELHGFHFKVRETGRLYRLEAARDPQLPRFWCMSVSRCAASGVIDEAELPWYGGDRMTREDLPAAVATIRDHFHDWLNLPQHHSMRAWVMDAAPSDTAVKVPATAARASRSS